MLRWRILMCVPLILVGDGAFQMTGMEVSTIARYGLNPIIIVLNNLGYGTERPMLDGKFNDVWLWQYSRIPEVLGVGRGFDVHTEDELETALNESRSHLESFCILDVHLDPQDISFTLKRLTDALGQRGENLRTSPAPTISISQTKLAETMF